MCVFKIKYEQCLFEHSNVTRTLIILLLGAKSNVRKIEKQNLKLMHLIETKIGQSNIKSNQNCTTNRKQSKKKAKEM